LDGIPFLSPSWGQWGLAGAVMGLVLLGWLIPRPWHKERMADKQNVITSLQATVDKQNDQISQLIKNNEVAVYALEALRREAVNR
jgi:hypothetical protein